MLSSSLDFTNFHSSETTQCDPDQHTTLLDVHSLHVAGLAPASEKRTTARPLIAVAADGRLFAAACGERLGIYDAVTLQLKAAFPITCPFPSVLTFDRSSCRVLVAWDDWYGWSEQGEDAGFAIFPADEGASSGLHCADFACCSASVSAALAQDGWTQDDIDEHFGSMDWRFQRILDRAHRRRACASAARYRHQGYQFPSFGLQESLWNATGTCVIALPQQPSAGAASVIRVADGHTVPLQGHNKSVTSAGFFNTQPRVFTYSFDGNVRIFDVVTGERVALLRGGARSQGWVAACSPDDRWLAAGNGDGVVRVWDTSKLEMHEPAFKLTPSAEARQSSRCGWVRGLQWQREPWPNGDWTLWFGSDAGIWAYRIGYDGAALWDCLTYSPKTKQRCPELNDFSLVGVQGAPNWLIIPGNDSSQLVYDFERRRRWKLPKADRAVALDNKRVLTAGIGGLVRVWTLPSDEDL